MNKQVVASVLSVMLSGCVSVSDQVSRHLAESRFSEALEVLEKHEGGAFPRGDLESDIVAARDDYTRAIEIDTESGVVSLLAEGSLYGAGELVESRAALCPWSIRIAEMHRESRSRITEVENAEVEWGRRLRDGSSKREVSREFLTVLSREPLWFAGTSGMQGLRWIACRSLVGAILAQLQASQLLLEDESISKILQDVELVGVSPELSEDLWRILHVLADLSPRDDGGLPHRLTADELTALDSAFEFRPLEPLSIPPGKAPADVHMTAGTGVQQGDSSVERRSVELCAIDIIAHCWSEFRRWLEIDFTKILKSDSVGYEEVEEGERWVGRGLSGAQLADAVAQAHITVAERLSRNGPAAALALLHLLRARRLGAHESSGRIAQIKEVVDATLGSTPRRNVALTFDCDPAVDPKLELIAQAALRATLAGGEASLRGLSVHATNQADDVVCIKLCNAEYTLDSSDVAEVASEYLAHFETVPNPRKAQLEIACNAAKSWISVTESGYQSAVSSHNIYPTQWSLISVNTAYNSYSRAVDDYNFKVRMYNAEPSTVQRPVYLPYVFHEGGVRHGWALSIEASVSGGRSLKLERVSEESDHVRIGTKRDDRDKGRRRDDLLEIDLGPEAGVRHLFRVAQMLKEDLAEPLGSIQVETTAGLHAEQEVVLSWLFHPFGIRADLVDRLGVPRWAAESFEEGAFLGKVGVSPPPDLLIGDCRASALTDVTTEDAALALSRFVCQTVVGKGAAETLGSGVLIGPGLVLTCAHVLTGPDINLRFTSGDWAGDHVAEVAFINEQRDVAILRVPNLANNRWANVRLDRPAAAGEAVIAIGNAALGLGGVNEGGVSAGVVSSPGLERNGSRFLSVDISVASGSSGGPVFSLNDGSVVGVVQLVATSPGFDSGVARVSSSGYMALAAPSNLLREWLGLKKQ